MGKAPVTLPSCPPNVQGNALINTGFVFEKRKKQWKEQEVCGNCTSVLAPVGRLVPAGRSTVKEAAEWANKWDETA